MDVRLRGGQIISDGQNVTVEAPSPNLQGRALVSNPRTDALIIPRNEPLLEVQCFKCQGKDIVVRVKFPYDDGYQLALCRDCVKDRRPGKPIVIDMEFVT